MNKRFGRHHDSWCFRSGLPSLHYKKQAEFRGYSLSFFFFLKLVFHFHTSLTRLHLVLSITHSSSSEVQAGLVQLSAAPVNIIAKQPRYYSDLLGMGNALTACLVKRFEKSQGTPWFNSTTFDWVDITQ